MPATEAWSNPDILIVEGVVKRAHCANNIAYYDVDIKKIYKPYAMNGLRRITIKDSYYRSTAQIDLKKNERVMLFVKEIDGGYYGSAREIDLDTQYGRGASNGIKLFLSLMSIEDNNKRSTECINSYNGGLSVPEKRAILDVMWETRSPIYSNTLIDMIKKENDPGLRSWAITILTNIGDGERAKELVYLLDDPNYDVKRQLLILFGVKKIKEAVPEIELVLKEKLSGMENWQADSLRKIAKEALDKISGKNTSPYWVY